MIKKVKRYIDEHELIRPGDRILAALSGGADSVALLSVLLAIKSEYDLTVEAVHVQHGLRGDEAERDAQFCVRLCDDLGIKLHLYRADVHAYAEAHKLGIEAAAREVRYAEFERLCMLYGYTKIAVAHHAGDNAETILMHLLRGSGIDGLRGILPKRENIIRPLLCADREEIEAYLQEQSLSYVTDSTNAETVYLRNQIRHALLKEIKLQYNPNFEHTMEEMSYLLRQDSLYLNAQADTAYTDVCTMADYGLRIDVAKYRTLAPAIALRVMKKAVATLLSRQMDISFDVIKKCHDLCMHGAVGKKADLPDGYMAAMEHDGLLMYANTGCNAFETEIKAGQSIWLAQEGVCLSAKVVFEKEMETAGCVCFDYDKLPKPLVVRFRKSGDRIQPSGMQGRKKLQDYFTDCKIPRSQRDTWPLVCVGHEVLWVCGKRKSALYGIDEQTKQILKLTYEVKES